MLREDDLILAYRETIRPLYAYVSRRVGGERGLAEDLVQEAWMRALGAWARQGIPDNPLAWLQTVAHNLLVSYFRRVRPQPMDVAAVDLADDRFSPDSPDTAAVVGWGMARLRRAHAEILEDFYFEGKSVCEIAAARSLSERAVEGRLRRARAKLRKKLDRIFRAVPAAPRQVDREGSEDARETRAR